MCFIECLKLCRALHKLGELWYIEYESKKEGYKEGVEQRGIDPGHKVFQVTTDPSELKMNESGEECACWQRVLVFQVGKEIGSDGERFEIGQRSQAGDDHLG